MAEIAIQPANVKNETAVSQSRGIGRHMGPLAVFIFAISGVSLTYTGVLPFATIAGLWPGSDLVLILSVAAGLGLFHAYTYAAIGAAAPRYGADYVVGSRVLSPPLAFASSWVMVIFFSLSAGTFIASLAQNTIPVFVRIFSIVTFNKNLLTAFAWVSTPNGIVSLGTIGVVLVFLLLILPPWVTKRVLLIGFILALMAWTIIFIQLGSLPAGSFENAWDRYFGEGNFLDHLFTARAMGMQADYRPGPAVFAGLLMGFWLFYGYFMPTCFAQEVKDTGRSLLFSAWGALLVSWLVLALAAVLLQRAIPIEWLAAESFLLQSGDYAGQAFPWVTLYGAIANPSPLLVWLLGIAWIYTILNLAHTLLYTASRIILAWVQDRLLPETVGYFHPGLKSPVIAVLLVCMVAEFGLVDASLNGDILQRFNPLYFMITVQLVPIAAIALLPYLKPDWYASAPGFVRRKIGQLPVITLVGFFTLVYLVAMVTANSLTRLFGGIGIPTLSVSVIVFGAGLIWFYGRRYYQLTQGEDLDQQFKHLPGE